VSQKLASKAGQRQFCSDPKRENVTSGRGIRLFRFADKYLGAPLVACLAVLRRRSRELPQSVRRVGLLNTAAIGDTVLMSGPIADILAAYPKSKIFLLTGPSNYEAGCLINSSIKVIRLPVFDPISSIREIRRLRLDVLLDFGSWARLNAIFSALSRAKFIVGFRTKAQHRHYAYDLSVDHSAQLHELQNQRKLLSALGITCRNPPRIPRSLIPGPANYTWKKPYLVFHLWPGGTGSKLKEWPLDRWIKLAEHFVERGYQILLSGGPSQRLANDRFTDRIDPDLRSNIFNLAGLSLAATSAVIVGAALVVSVDTGIMHLAAALNVSLVALMGPASRKRWGPIGRFVSVIQSPLAGCGYLNLGFEISRNPPRCMEAISFDSVRAACEGSLLSDTISAIGKSNLSHTPAH
jgi:ADP-heptose:LPS heptosyltransferase